MSIPKLPNAISVELISTSEEKSNNELTLWQKVKYMRTHITVEPLLFFYILPGTMGLLATQNMNLEKACRVNLGYNSSICDAMVNRNHSGYEEYQEVKVQELVAKMVSIKMAVVGFFPTILLLFFGSWSDRHMRRKPVILFPIFVDIISGLELCICAYFLYEISVEYVTLADCFPYSLGGGWTCVFLGVYSYVSGISTDEDRTIRIGFVSIIQNISMTLGNILGGFLMKPLGYLGAYLVTCFTMSLCLIYGIIMIKDKKIEPVEKFERKSAIKDFLDVQNVKNTFKICFKQGPSHRKWKIVVIMMATILITGPLQGELSVIYLYTRIKYGWNEVDYSIYNTVQFIIQMIGSTFALSYFSKKLKLDDAVLGIIALASKISACVIYAFAPSGTFFFLGCFVEIFHGTCHIALRSLMAKIVPPHELGKSNSVFGVCESLMPLAFGPFYATLYNYTLNVFPGCFYLVSAFLYFSTLPLFIWLYKINKRTQRLTLKNSKQQQQQQPEENALIDSNKKTNEAIGT